MHHQLFVGRQSEIEGLEYLLRKKSASLVVVQGRRRIGKSRLIEEFAKKSRYHFYRFAGLPPTSQLTAQDQRNEFVRILREQFGTVDPSSMDWGDLFSQLANHTKERKTIILLDEISWMADGDPTFLGKLKNAWDMHFNKNHQLILVLCGSVSAWIQKNILRHTGFVGRISHALFLEELPLNDCNTFLKNIGARYSTWEKFLILSIIGGVPRYFEELDASYHAEENIRRICFQPEGLLYREFDNIFSDLFSHRSSTYEAIIHTLQERHLSYTEICEMLKIKKSSHILECLDDLVKSGFISRDYTWDIKSLKESKLSRYRIKDNYIRFYLKYIQPNKGRIEKGHFKDYLLSNLPGWSSMMGYQFENIVLANRKWILGRLRLRPEDVLADNPFFQRKGISQQGCQIDYLVQTRFKTLFICEVKFLRKEVASDVITDMKEKIERLRLPKGYACNPVLIHVNGVSDPVIDSGYFAEIIDITEAFKN